MTSRGSFELAIGSLVLDGFESAARHGCAQAFTDEFERLVRQQGCPDPQAHTGSVWRLPALSIPAAASDPPSRVGRALARSLFEALHRAASEP